MTGDWVSTAERTPQTEDFVLGAWWQDTPESDSPGYWYYLTVQQLDDGRWILCGTDSYGEWIETAIPRWWQPITAPPAD